MLALVHTIFLSGECLQNEKHIVKFDGILHKHVWRKLKTVISSRSIIHSSLICCRREIFILRVAVIIQEKAQEGYQHW